MIPGGVLPYVGYIGMCSLKGYGLAALIINRYRILGQVINRVGKIADFGLK